MRKALSRAIQGLYSDGEQGLTRGLSAIAGSDVWAARRFSAAAAEPQKLEDLGEFFCMMQAVPVNGLGVHWKSMQCVAEACCEGRVEGWEEAWRDG